MNPDVMIPLVIFGSVVAIVKILSDNKIRRQLIDKGQVDDRARAFLTRDAELARLSSLKWGMVLIALGVGLLVSYMNPDMLEDGGTFGLMLVLAGVAFLIYYAVAQKHLARLDEKYPAPSTYDKSSHISA